MIRQMILIFVSPEKLFKNDKKSSKLPKNPRFISENIPSVLGSINGIIIPIVNPPKIADKTDSMFEETNKVLF